MRYLLVSMLLAGSVAFSQSEANPVCRIDVGNQSIGLKNWIEEDHLFAQATSTFMLYENGNSTFLVREMNDIKTIQQEFSNPLNLSNGRNFLQQQNSVRLRLDTRSSLKNLQKDMNPSDTAEVNVGNGIDQVDSGHPLSTATVQLSDLMRSTPVPIALTYLSQSGQLKTTNAAVKCR